MPRKPKRNPYRNPNPPQADEAPHPSAPPEILGGIPAAPAPAPLLAPARTLVKRPDLGPTSWTLIGAGDPIPAELQGFPRKPTFRAHHQDAEVSGPDEEEGAPLAHAARAAAQPVPRLDPGRPARRRGGGRARAGK